MKPKITDNSTCLNLPTGSFPSAQTTPTQNAAFLAALSTKSTHAETIDEISGCTAAMRELSTPVEHAGIDAALVGETLMHVPDTAAAFTVAEG